MMREAGGSCAEGETGNGGRCLFWKGEKRKTAQSFAIENGLKGGSQENGGGARTGNSRS